MITSELCCFGDFYNLELWMMSVVSGGFTEYIVQDLQFKHLVLQCMLRYRGSEGGMRA